MASTILMPKQGNTVESCLILEWRVKVGDAVTSGDVLCSVETDKATVDVESEESGTVLALLYEEGNDAPVMQPIVILGDAGEDISELLSSAGSSAESLESLAEEPAPAQSSAPVQSSAGVSMPEVGQHAPAEADQHPAASPRARKAAEARAVNLSGLRGSGPGGRILEEDVLRFAEERGSLSPAARDRLAAEQADTARVISGAGMQTASGEEGAVEEGAIDEGELRGMRKVIARRMMESLHSTAQYTLHTSASAASILKWRKIYKESNEALKLRGINIGDMAIFALSRTLKNYPQLNAEFRDGKMYQYQNVHLAFAVDTPRGLMVPVLRNANEKSLKQISAETKELAQACQNGSIQPDLLTGATCTVSNLGAWGIERFTPVINPPQVAIIGLCSISMKAIQKNDTTVFEPHMGISMTIDHQVVDGAPAARFLSDFSKMLARFELPAAM
ncbi:MAG: dihydrolipoamide acetyltransferase family protein [Salinispira sp.]